MKIEKLDNNGRGITYYKNKIMFVENALPGEEVEVKDIIEKKNIQEAKVREYTNTSEYRVIPKCPYYEICGGCNLMHMGIEYQEDFKNEKIAEILKKYANLTDEVKMIKSDKDLFYRNKISLKIENSEWGYYDNASHTIVNIDNCLLASKPINDLLNNRNIFKIKDGTITIRSNYNNELLIVIYTKEKNAIDLEKIPSNVIGIVYNDKTIYGQNYFYDAIGDFKFKVSYNSFFQINNYVASRIFEILNNNFKGKNLLDLYCGVGTLGISLKDKYERIYGIEKIENAIIDAKENAKINEVENTYFFAGDTSKILKKINKKFDTVIVDPPRSGLNKETIELVLNIKPKNICYVSCDPMTLSRDLKILNENYKVKKVYALDMFPNTYHCETICILERR